MSSNSLHWSMPPPMSNEQESITMARDKNVAAINKFSDHEVITPVNKLRKALTHRPPAPGEEDPVANADDALSGLASEFEAWMDSECERLDEARRVLGENGFTASACETLFRAAHDIKGEAATFGYPALTSAADSLCRLIEFSPEMTRIPFQLVEQHVDAVRAIRREYANSDAKELARQLTARLREVTDEFLLRENHDRPDVIEQINSPSLVPDFGH